MHQEKRDFLPNTRLSHLREASENLLRLVDQVLNSDKTVDEEGANELIVQLNQFELFCKQLAKELVRVNTKAIIDSMARPFSPIDGTDRLRRRVQKILSYLALLSTNIFGSLDPQLKRDWNEGIERVAKQHMGFDLNEVVIILNQMRAAIDTTRDQKIDNEKMNQGFKALEVFVKSIPVSFQ